MSDAALFDSSAGSAFARLTLPSPTAKVYVGVQLYRTSAQTAAQTGFSAGNQVQAEAGGSNEREVLTVAANGDVEAWSDFATGAGFFASGTWHQWEFLWDTSLTTVDIAIDGVAGLDNRGDFPGDLIHDIYIGNISATALSGQGIYIGAVWIGTDVGLHDILLEDWSGGTFGAWTSTTGAASVVTGPSAPPAFVPSAEFTPPPPPTQGRVGIAFDDGPLDPDPTYTWIDTTYENLVSGYDIETGKQTELDRTDTGTATVYLNDTLGLFDPLNTGSAYFGKLVGKQILLRLWNPVTEEWVEEWQGKIRDYGYRIFPVLGGDGKPILANIQIDCVDIFDYLGGYGLQPGVNGDTPPAGNQGIVFYEDTAGTVDDRIIEALTDAGIDSTRWVVFSGNVKVRETKYDPGDAMLTVLRDAADAEFPGLANIYVDRFGRFVFHGRYARFDPEGVIADGPVSSDTWDFHRWKVGDGTAIIGDSDYAQIRVLGYTYGESDIVNSTVCWPAGMDDTDMPGQVFEDAASILAHGKHSLPPMGDLIISEGSTTGHTAKVECQKFGEFYVHYLKDPQTRITSLMVKAIGPDDARAASTWDVLCKADISDIMRTTVGYPNGVGIDMDNYIEGYTKRVRPLNPTHDYVEVEFNLTPTAWAMDPDGILAPAS